jgi:hypothetical protein
MTYLFTKEGCEKCEWVKSRLADRSVAGLRVMNLDDDNSEALAMLAYFECVSLAEKKLPILVADNGRVITGALRIKDYLAGSRA